MPFLALITTAGAANAEERTQQFYNDKGQIVGSATRDGNQTTFRNEKGQITGTATTRGNTTTFSNERGPTVRCTAVAMGYNLSFGLFGGLSPPRGNLAGGTHRR
jgi:YD repeat-containing protein